MISIFIGLRGMQGLTIGEVVNGTCKSETRRDAETDILKIRDRDGKFQ